MEHPSAPLAFQTMIVCQVSRKLEIDIFNMEQTNTIYVGLLWGLEDATVTYE